MAGAGSKRKSDESLNILLGKLRGPCQCKKQSVKPNSPSCFSPFTSGDLWERLQQWRSRFADLHKLDQDRFATRMCKEEIFGHFSETTRGAGVGRSGRFLLL